MKHVDELETHKQFIANELMAFSTVTQGMSRKEQWIVAWGNAEYIVRWVTSRPVKRSWWRRLVGGA